MAEPLPAKVPLKLYRGDTRVWEDTFRLSPIPPDTVGEPIDLTGHNFLAQIRSIEDATIIMAVIDVQVVDAPNGVIRRVLSATEARKLVAGSAVWDLQITDPAGVVRTYMSGRVRILPDVSRT